MKIEDIRQQRGSAGEARRPHLPPGRRVSSVCLYNKKEVGK